MFAYYFAVVGIFTFVIWGLDKYRARARQWRIPERVLLLLTLIGGAFGALAGMIVFRHKIRKPLFWVVVGVGCFVQGLILISC